MSMGKTKKYICAGLVLVMAISVTGCVKFETPERSELYVEYAANAVLKHDKNYIDRMQVVEVMAQEEMTTSKQQTTVSNQETQNGGSASNGQDDNSNQPIAALSMEQILGLQGITITPVGCETVNSYPDNGSELGMSMIAVKGYQLMIMKFQVTNVSGSDQNVDIRGKNAVYKGIIDDKVRLNVQVTALLDALNTWNGALAAGETKELVLVFQIHEADAENIGSVKLNVTCQDKQGEIIVK